jgi:hypothetical protein
MTDLYRGILIGFFASTTGYILSWLIVQIIKETFQGFMRARKRRALEPMVCAVCGSKSAPCAIQYKRREEGPALFTVYACASCMSSVYAYSIRNAESWKKAPPTTEEPYGLFSTKEPE